MKYAVFLLALCGVPLCGLVASTSWRLRATLLGAALFLQTVPYSSINFWSMERYRGHDKGFEVTAGDLLLSALAASLIMGRFRQIRWLPRNSLLWALYLAWSALSALLSEFPVLSGAALLKDVLVFLNYWAVYNYVRLDKPEFVVKGALLISSLSIIVQVSYQKWILHIYRCPGPSNLGGHPNALPTFLMLYLPFLMCWTLMQRRIRTPIAVSDWLIYFGLIGSVMATFSRAGMLVVMALLGGCMALAAVRAPKGRLVRLLPLVLLLTLAFAVKSGKNILVRFLSAPVVSGDVRRKLNQSAFLMANSHLLGVGPNLFAYSLSVHEEYGECVDGYRTGERDYAVISNPGQAPFCHSVWWTHAAETGYPGLLLAALIYFRFWWRPFRYGWGRDTLPGSVCLGLSMGFFAALTIGFYEPVLLLPTHLRLYFCLCGLALAIQEQNQASD